MYQIKEAIPHIAKSYVGVDDEERCKRSSFMHWIGKKENNFYYRLITGRHLKEKKINLLDLDNYGFSLEPFEKVLDIFSDGSFFAFSTPGHTKYHISYLINKQPTPQCIIEDAELNRWALESGIKVDTDYLLSQDKRTNTLNASTSPNKVVPSKYD